MTAGPLLCLLLTAQAAILGIAVDHQIEAYTRVINVTVSQAVLLPVTYTLTHPSSKYTVEWITQDRAILYHEVTNCSTSPQGFPTWSRGKTTVYPMYKGRVEFYTLNASLLLYDPQINDSGIYTIVFSTAYSTSKTEISVWVHTTSPSAIYTVLPLSTGIAVDHHIEAYTSVINVTVGQAFLLPVTYTLTHPSSKYTVEWITQDRAILYHEVTNGSTNPQGFPTWSRGKTTVYPMYKGRVEFYTLNASLLLYDPQINDSGIYTIVFSTAYSTSKKDISVWVQASLSSGEDGARRWTTWIFALRTVLCFLPIAGLWAIFYIWGC